MRSRTGHDLSEKHAGWLWDGEKLIPRDELTMLVGFDGKGKSSFALSLVADMTTGALSGKREIVFLAMQEDSEAITKARLKVNGADLGSCRFQPKPDQEQKDTGQESRSAWAFPEDQAAFEDYLVQEKVTVAILDSLDFHVANLAAQVARRTLGALREMAQRHNITIILVHHFNKASAHIDSAIGGGRGIKGAMRCIMVWGERPPTPAEEVDKDWKEFVQKHGRGVDPETALSGEDEDSNMGADDDYTTSTHVLTVHKNSYGKKYPAKLSSLYRAYEVQHPYAAKESVLRFEFVDECRVSPQDLYKFHSQDLKRDSESKHDLARELLLRFLVTNGAWMRAEELESHVMAAGISRRTVAQARSELAKAGTIEKAKQGNSWFWRVKVPEFAPGGEGEAKSQ